MCVRAPYKFENDRQIVQSIVRFHGEHISVLKEGPTVPRNPLKGDQSNRKTSTKETHLIGKYKLKETNLIERHSPKGTKPIGGHLQKKTELIEKETKKIDRESPLNTNPQHTNCFYQTHHISSDTRRTSPSTARGRGGTEGGDRNLIAEPRVVETKASRKAKVLGKSTV